MFGAATTTNNSGKRSEIEGLLGSMSPMAGSKGTASFSLGDGGGGGSKASAASGMSIDDSAASTRPTFGGGSRAPFGELQNTSAFEFKTSSSTLGGAHKQQQQPLNKPAPTFTFGGGSTAFGKAPTAAPAAAPAASVSAAVAGGGLGLRGRKQQGGPSLMHAMTASPEPTTPASSGSTCEPRGGGGIMRGGGPAGAPPLTTLHSLHAFGTDDSAGSDNDTVTPLAPAPAGHVPLSTPPPPAPVMPRKQLVLSDVLLWKAPLQTATIFAGGLLAFWALNFAAYGAHRFSVVSGLSYILLLDLSANFVRYFVSQKWHDQCLWGGAAQMKHFLTTVNAYVLHLAAAHDRFLSAVDPFVTLKVAVALWASAWIGCYISLWWCVLLGYVGAFTVPVAYQACKGQLTAVAQVIRTHTVDRVDATGLPRTARFLFLVAAVAALWCTSSFTQSAIGFFVALAYWRTLLAPREIDVIRTVAEPYTVSAFKVGRRISTAASDAFDRMSTVGPKTRTKSHFGSKARAE